MKVLLIGESVIDHVYCKNGDVSINIKQQKPEKHVGGVVLAASVVLSRLGVDCTLLTSLGRDNEARVIKKFLKHEKIKLLAKIQNKTKVNTFIVNTQNGYREKLRGNTIHPDIKNIDRKFLHQFDAIVMDRHERTAFYEIITKKRTNTKLFIDSSTEISPFTMDMFKHAEYPILPIEALTKIDDRKDITICLETLSLVCKKPITITAGELGSFIYDKGKITLIPAFKVKAVDATGAGDVYRGSFAYAIMHGWDMKKSATFANYISALQCTKIGNAAAIPTKEEMNLFDKLSFQTKPITIPGVQEYFTGLYQTV